MMIQKRGLITLLFLFVFLSGCYSLDITQTIEPSGESQVTFVIDMSQILESMPQSNSSNSSITVTEDPNTPTMNGCDDYENISVVTCTSLEPGVIELQGTFTVPITETESLQEIRYEYNAVYVFDILEQISTSPDEQLSQENLGQLKMLNPELTYIVQLPGTITDTQVGDIFENAVIIDLFDLESVRSATIYSTVEKPLPWTLIGMIGGGILLAFLIVGVLLANMAHKSHPKPDANEIACKSYIEQYKKMYSAEQLKQGLIASGHDPVKAGEYVQKYYK